MHSILENLRQAFSAIKENRLRTLMSITGIAVGIASVMTVGVVSQSGKDYIYSELSTYGLNSLWVYRYWEENNPFASQREGRGITNDDYKILKAGSCCPNVLSVSAKVYPDNWMVNLRVGNTFHRTSVEGVDETYLKINNDELSSGRDLRHKDIIRKQNVAIIGPKTKAILFGETVSALGKSLYMGDTKFIIVGVLKSKNREFLSAIGATQGYDEDNRLLIPYTRYQQILGTKDIHTLRAEARGQKVIDVALDEITTVLHRQHNNNYVYQTESMRGWIDTTNNILKTISNLGAVSAIVALLIGGIGIFNIMSASVMERTREIGIRKALGATQRDIMIQFLSESMYISVIGGILGSALGGVVLLIMIYLAGFSLTAAWGYLFIAITMSIMVGLLAGFFPARHAANLPPAEALRWE